MKQTGFILLCALLWVNIINKTTLGVDGVIRAKSLLRNQSASLSDIKSTKEEKMSFEDRNIRALNKLIKDKLNRYPEKKKTIYHQSVNRLSYLILFVLYYQRINHLSKNSLIGLQRILRTMK